MSCISVYLVLDLKLHETGLVLALVKINVGTAFCGFVCGRFGGGRGGV
jgi:hypothetical protein